VQIIRQQGEQPVPLISLYIKSKTLYANITLLSSKTGTGFILQGNGYHVLNPDWDENHNDWAIEVTDEYKTPIFQMIRKSRKSLEINGWFALHNVVLAYTPNMMGRVLGPDGQPLHEDFVPPKTFLQPIFKHSGRRHPKLMVNGAPDDLRDACPPAIKGRVSIISGPITVGP